MLRVWSEGFGIQFVGIPLHAVHYMHLESDLVKGHAW